MTLSRLSEIEERAERATSGPWIMPREDDEFFQPNTVRCYVGLNKERILLTFNYHFQWEADRAFVQAARQDVPALVRALRRALDELRAIEAICEDNPCQPCNLAARTADEARAAALAELEAK